VRLEKQKTMVANRQYPQTAPPDSTTPAVRLRLYAAPAAVSTLPRVPGSGLLPPTAAHRPVTRLSHWQHACTRRHVPQAVTSA